MSWLSDTILKYLKAVPLTRDNAPGILPVVEEMAKKLNIPAPTIHILPQIDHGHPVLNALSGAPNAASLSRDAIFLTEPLLRLFNVRDLSQPVSEELKAIIAHEMHHCGHRGSMMLMSRVPVLALPAAALIATYLYDRAHAKAKKDGDHSKENMAKHIESEARSAKETLPHDVQQSTFLNGLLYYGKYVAAAAAGIGGGLLLARYGARHHEFAADKFAAEVVGKEPMVNALRKVHQAIGQSVSEHHEAEAFKGILAETIGAHPSFAERAMHIRGR